MVVVSLDVKNLDVEIRRGDSGMAREQEFIDPDHQAIVEFAEVYLDDDEQQDFIDTLMERLGYDRVSVWERPPAKSAGQRQQGKPLLKSGSQRHATGTGNGSGSGNRRDRADDRRPSYFKR